MAAFLTGIVLPHKLGTLVRSTESKKTDLSMSEILQIQDITKTFGGLSALTRVSVSIHEGESVGLIGPNGAGKTTLFNVISGMKPNSGRIIFRGKDITGLKSHEICHRGIARTFQLVRPFLELSTLDNVTCALIFGRRKNEKTALEEIREEAANILKLVKLDHRTRHLAKELVFAERRRLELARALATGPDLILLDEAMAGLSAPEATQILDIVAKLKSDYHLTFFLVEHVLRLITAICNRIIVLNFGERLAEGPPKEVLQRPEVITAYLGGKHA
jgi:branched-chain amino acid transport system ATP-binding protein